MGVLEVWQAAHAKGALSPTLVKRGWSQLPHDICWLACDKPGYLQTIDTGLDGEVEIVLCKRHLLEMESTASLDYSRGDEPKEGGVWPWVYKHEQM